MIVLSHDLWQRHFAGDPGIVGRPVTINRRPATVVGVTAASFRGTDVGVVPAFWIPFSMIDEVEARSGPVTQNRRRFWLSAVGRLDPGADLAAARAELDVLAKTLNAAHGRGAERGFHLERAGQIDSRLRTLALGAFSVAMASTILVLLMACSNVANLLLGRASVRRGEIAARMALGASRARLVRQLLTESLLLALLGGAGGWLIASYVSSLAGLIRTPLGWPLDLTIAPDARVLLFSVALSMATGVVFGLVPALRATSPDLVTDLKAGARGPETAGRFGLRSGLVVVQVAVCTVLLLCTGLFLRSLQASRTVDVGVEDAESPPPGVRSRPGWTNRRSVPSAAAGGPRPRPQRSGGRVGHVDEQRAAHPDREQLDVRPCRARQGSGVAADTHGHLYGRSRLLRHDGHSGRGGTGRGPRARLRRTSSDRQRRVRARGVSRSLPRRPPNPRRREGARHRRRGGHGEVALDRRGPAAVDLSADSERVTAGETPRGVTLVVKTAGSPTSLVASVREAIRAVDRSLAVFDVRTMERHVSDALIVPRLMWMLSATAGTIGLAIATLGVYGVVSFAVARRRRELGIRLAVGARPREVVFMVLKQGATLALVGIALGCLVALGITRFTAGVLYAVSPTDPLTFAAVPLLLVLVALAACLVPARAAARLDPAEVLRRE